MVHSSASQTTSDMKSNATVVSERRQQPVHRSRQNSESRDGASLSYPTINRGGHNSKSVQSSVTLPEDLKPNPDLTWAEGQGPRKPSSIAKSERKKMCKYVTKFWREKQSDGISIGFQNRIKYEESLRKSGQWAK